MVITYPANIPVKVSNKFQWYNINLYKIHIVSLEKKLEQDKISVVRKKVEEEMVLPWEAQYWVDAKYINCNN